MKQKGITHEESNTNQPNENGAVERQHRTIKECARCLLLATDSPPFLWSFAVQHAADIWNSLPRKNKNKSPLELFCGQVPDYNRFYVFGSHGFAKHPKQKLKFNGNVPCVYLGLSQSSKGFRVFLPRQRKLGTVRDIEVDEVGSLTKSQRKFWRSTLGVFDTMRGSGLAPVPRNRRKTSDTEVAVFTDLDDEVVNPSSDDGEMVVNTENEAPRNFTDLSRSNILPEGTKRRRQKPVYSRSLRLAVSQTAVPPKNYRSIAKRADKDAWYAAYHKELTSLTEVGHMEVVPRPRNAPVIPLLELFVVKYDNIADQFIGKCRFVARGDLQPKYGNFYAPVANTVSFRLFLALSTRYSAAIRQLDVSTAFLYGRLEHPIHLELPVGHPQRTGQAMVWRTSTAVYGLCESPQRWNMTIHDFLARYGFRRLVTDPCVYVMNKGGNNSRSHPDHSGQIDSRPVADSDHTGPLETSRLEPKNIGLDKLSKTSEFQPYFNMVYPKDHIESPVDCPETNYKYAGKLPENSRRTVDYKRMSTTKLLKKECQNPKFRPGLLARRPTGRRSASVNLQLYDMIF